MEKLDKKTKVMLNNLNERSLENDGYMFAPFAI